ncbi:MAG: serine/threonine-protein kinase, partial [Pseudomonadota bacterium]
MSDTHDPLVTGGGLLAQSALAARERQRLLTDRFGDYQAAGHLGEGGMAVVLKGRRADGQFEKSVAIKVLGRSAGKDFEARTRQEIQILADLNHPGIVPLLDAGVSEQGYSYLVMDLIEGVRIDQWKAPSSTTLKDIVERVAQVADALAHAHRSLVVHGDLKPSNILVTDAGEPKLLDFGVSAVLSAEGGPDADEGTVARALTPAYASPEQLKGAKMTPASDIYQLGMLLDTLLAGSPAYAGENYAEAVQRAQTPAELPGLNQRIVDRQLAARVRGDLQAIIYRCCREAPSARYGSADAVARDLRAFLGGYPVEARPLAAGARAWRFANRHRIPVAICALSLLTLILATAGYVQRIEQQHEVATAAALKAQRLNATLRGVIGAASPLELGAASEETQLLLAQTSRRIQTLLAGEQDLLPELLQTLAGAQIQMGSFAAAEDNLRQALTAAENSTANPLTIAAIQGELGRLATLDEDWARAEELLESAWSGLGEAPDAAPE